MTKPPGLGTSDKIEPDIGRWICLFIYFPLSNDILQF